MRTQREYMVRRRYGAGPLAGESSGRGGVWGGGKHGAVLRTGRGNYDQSVKNEKLWFSLFPNG